MFDGHCLWDAGFPISSLLRLTICRFRVAPDIFWAHVPLHLNSELLWARGADTDIHRVISEVRPSLGPHQRLFGFCCVLHNCASSGSRYAHTNRDEPNHIPLLKWSIRDQDSSAPIGAHFVIKGLLIFQPLAAKCSARFLGPVVVYGTSPRRTVSTGFSRFHF